MIPPILCYSWSNFDAAVAQAQTSGQDILYTVYATPQWASSNPTDTNCSRGTAFPPGSCDPPNDIDAAPGSGLGDGTNLHFRDFVTAITTHVGPGVVKYWEVWDEPNVSHSWRGTNAQLLRLAKDTYNLVKARRFRRIDYESRPMWEKASPSNFQFIWQPAEASMST